MRASLVASTGKVSASSASIAFSFKMPVVVSSEAPLTPSRRSGRLRIRRLTSSAPSSMIRSGSVSMVRSRYPSKSSSLGSWVAKTLTPRSARAAQTSSWVESGLLPETVTSAPASEKRIARYAVFASRWMVIAILWPRSEPSASCSPDILFKTGACWATQSILRCPSGAREGSLTSDSLIMSLLIGLLFYEPDSGSLAAHPVYSSGKRNAVVSFLTLESHHRREAQIQDHGRLGELRDHPGDLAALHLRHAPGSQALPFEALGTAVLPGHGRQRAAHDLLPLRVQRCSQACDAHPPLRPVPHSLAGRAQVLPAARHCLHALRRGFHRATHGGLRVEYLRQRPWPVGHYYVDAEVEQAAHLVRLVYGPRVHPHAPGMRRPDETWGHNQHSSVPYGNLQRVVGGAHETL